MNSEWKITKFNTVKGVISLIGIAAFLVWNRLDHTTSAQLILNGIKNKEFTGKVDSVFRDEKDHNIKKVRLTTGYVYGLYPEWESEVEAGDSLFKRAGSLVVFVIKKDKTVNKLDYEEMVKTFKN